MSEKSICIQVRLAKITEAKSSEWQGAGRTEQRDTREGGERGREKEKGRETGGLNKYSCHSIRRERRLRSSVGHLHGATAQLFSPLAHSVTSARGRTLSHNKMRAGRRYMVRE